MSGKVKSEELSSSRVEALDAFRGVCSFLIMVTHILLIVPQVCQRENLGYLYGGFGWKVPYFFVLSGFVLTLSYQRSKLKLRHPFRSFLVSRILRIYPIFFITTIAMFLLKVIFGAGAPLDGASVFYNISWRIAPSFVNLLHALTLIGLENTWLYNGPAWTLVFDMRFSIMFPLFIGVLRRSWLSIALFIGMSLMAAHISSSLERVDMFYNPNYLVANLCSMFGFMLLYASGVLLALNRERLSQLYLSLPRWGSVGVLLATVTAMLNPLWLRGVIPSAVGGVIEDCVMMVGVMAWIIILLNNRVISAIFSKRFLVNFGRSSFSVYMWHMPIVTALYMLLYQWINVWYIVLLSIVMTLVVAPLSFRYIEQPIIAWSHRLRR